MKAPERRQAIANLLLAERKPITGADLSARFGVSRQIIVQDIAAIKAMGYVIIPTHYGYVLSESPLRERVLKVNHTKSDTEDELRTIVSLGGSVADVFVMHNVYGKISAPLNILTENDVTEFMHGVTSGRSTVLMNITGGDHYHTVRAKTEELLDSIEAALIQKGYITK